MSNERKFKVGDRVRILKGTRTGEVRTVASIRPAGFLRLADDRGWCLAYDYDEVEIVDTAPSTTHTAPDITTCNDCELQYVAATATTWDEGPRDFICPQCCAVARGWEIKGLRCDLSRLRKSLDRAADEARRNSGVAKLESPFSPRKVRGDGW